MNHETNDNEPLPFGLRIQKYMIWAALIGVIYLLRNLFPVIFLTFILTYIANSVLRIAATKFKISWPRRVTLTVIYLVFIAAAVGVVYAIIPRIYDEARQLAKSYIEGQAEIGANGKHHIAKAESAPKSEPAPKPAHTTDSRIVAGAQGDSTLFETGAFTKEVSASSEVGVIIGGEVLDIVDEWGVNMLGVDSYKSFRESAVFRNMHTKLENYVMTKIPEIASKIGAGANYLGLLILHMMLALLFSFLILWDLPRISESVKSFAHGRSAEVYAEISPSMRAFGTVLGKAFEAQSGIALVNTILTSIGFFILGVPSIALLAVIVFFCSYIPVLGVFLSTIPAALLAYKVGGATLIFGVVVMVLIVHAIEAYGLNPLIYGHHMRMHPVGVLVVLMVGEHLFGVWGLLLGVPVTAFFLKYVLKGEEIT